MPVIQLNDLAKRGYKRLSWRTETPSCYAAYACHSVPP